MIAMASAGDESAHATVIQEAFPESEEAFDVEGLATQFEQSPQAIREALASGWRPPVVKKRRS